jgi:ABC-type transport system involved in cytochrome bd biosynthesis fused ATPase/permease subunit
MKLAFSRIEALLKSDEIQQNLRATDVDKDTDAAISVNGDFTWDLKQGKTGEEVLNLRQLSLSIKKGEFVCIIGDVGCGKSSLLQALLGEMIFVSPSYFHKPLSKDTIQSIFHTRLVEAPIRVAGSVAYVEQQPWIQNMTIRENILFGSEYDEERYCAVIEAC